MIIYIHIVLFNNLFLIYYSCLNYVTDIEYCYELLLEYVIKNSINDYLLYKTF